MKKMSEEHSKGQPFDIYAYFKRFTMETIWSCGFGVDTDMQNNINDPYLICSQTIFDAQKGIKVLMVLSLFITELSNLWLQIDRVDNFIRCWLLRIIPFTKKFIQEDPDKWILRQAYEMIDKREHINQMTRTDLVQLMLESASNDDFIQVSDSNFCCI
jgi:cytochrome P450